MQRRLAAGLSVLTVAAVAGPATAAWVLPSSSGAGTATARALEAPTGVTATAAGSSSISVAFSPAAAQPPGTVVRVLRLSGPGATTVCETNTSPCTDTGLTPGAQYSYAAQTVLAGWTKTSPTVTATTTGTLAVATTSLPGATTNSSYSHTLSASGGATPYTWTLGAGAPAWLTVSSAGVLSGTPPTNGTVNVPVQVRDALLQTASATLSLTSSTAPATATQLVLVAPTNWTAGSSQQVTLTARTAGGAVDTSFAGTKTITWGGTSFVTSPSGASPTATSQLSFSSGSATATVTLVKSGVGTLTATTSGLTGSSASTTVAAATASALAFGQQPTPGKFANEIKPSPTVVVQDAFGNAVASSATVVLSIASGPSTTVTGGTAAASAGTATFNSLKLGAAGTFTLTASSTGLAPSTSTSFTLN